MTCKAISCLFYDREATAWCPAHADYFRRVLADDRYRSEPVPPLLIAQNAIQGHLL